MIFIPSMLSLRFCPLLYATAAPSPRSPSAESGRGPIGQMLEAALKFEILPHKIFLGFIVDGIRPTVFHLKKGKDIGLYGHAGDLDGHFGEGCASPPDRWRCRAMFSLIIPGAQKPPRSRLIALRGEISKRHE